MLIATLGHLVPAAAFPGLSQCASAPAAPRQETRTTPADGTPRPTVQRPNLNTTPRRTERAPEPAPPPPRAYVPAPAEGTPTVQIRARSSWGDIVIRRPKTVR